MKLVPPFSATNGDNSGEYGTTIACSIGLLLGMIFAIVGIKFKWFKHRLSFEQLPSGSISSSSSSRAAISQKGEAIPLQGIFRRREDADSFVDSERPKTLPPIRIRSTEVQIPKPNRYSEPNHISDSAVEEQTGNEPPIPPPMPPDSSTIEHRSETRSQKSNRSQSSSRSKSSERSKKSDERVSSKRSDDRGSKKSTDRDSKKSEGGSSKRSDDRSTSSVKSSSSKKKKGPEATKVKVTPTELITHEAFEIPRAKRRDREKSRKPPSGSEDPLPSAPKTHSYTSHRNAQSDQTRHFEKLKDDKQLKGDRRTTERRPTGYIRPSDEEMEMLEQLSKQEEERDAHVNGMKLKLDGFSDNDDDNQVIFETVKAKPVPEPRKRISSETKSPPSVASVAASAPSDSWSAVARHRFLTEELTKQHSALKPVAVANDRSNGVASSSSSEFRNPLSSMASDGNKPRTMRDMKRNKDVWSQNDRVVLGQEQRNDADA